MANLVFLIYPDMTKDKSSPTNCALVKSSGGFGVNDGTRTHDDRDHNPGLYQLSYAHHCFVRANTLKLIMFGQQLLLMARPAGLEPATPGLAYHYRFRGPDESGSWSGLSLHHLRRRTFSLYGALR